jgi:very-short-patch-repair endonuclease
VPIKRHIADFVCIDAKLTIEVDGGQHSENTARDAARSAELERSGFVVIRLWNEDVLKNIDDVLDEIYRIPIGERELQGGYMRDLPLPGGERSRAKQSG